MQLNIVINVSIIMNDENINRSTIQGNPNIYELQLFIVFEWSSIVVYTTLIWWQTAQCKDIWGQLYQNTY